MFNLLENSCMVINMHSSFDLNYAINMRVFEALSAGCLLFTEKNILVQKYFENEKDLVIYRSLNDLSKKIRYFKKNTDEALEIAKRGKSKIIEKHGINVRFNEFLSVIE